MTIFNQDEFMAFYLLNYFLVEWGGGGGTVREQGYITYNRCLNVLFKSMGMFKGDHFQEKLKYFDLRGPVLFNFTKDY